MIRILPRINSISSFPMLCVYWAALSVLLLAPYILMGRIIVPGGDTINYYYPAMHWFADALKNGDSFLWNPTMLSGFPSYLSQVSGYIEPINIVLFSLVPTAVLAYHVRMALDFVLVCAFSYLIARRWGISPFSAFFIGPTYLMAFHWWYLSNTVIANTLFLLPFLLYVFVRAMNAVGWSSRLFWAVLGGAGVGWVFLGGYAQIAIYCLVLVGLYALYDFYFLSGVNGRTPRRFIMMTAILGTVSIIGFFVGSPQILAALAHTLLSVRSGGLAYELTQGKVLRFSEFIYFLLPDYLRLPLFNGGRKPLFIGFFSLLAAIVGILNVDKNKILGAVLMLFLFSLLTAIPHSPIYYALYQLPVFELFRYPYRWMYLGVWALAVLAAFGLDYMRGSAREECFKWLAFGSVVVAAPLTAAAVCATLFGEWFWGPLKHLGFQLFSSLAYSPEAYPKGLEHYAGSIDRSIDAWRSLLSFSNEYFLIPLLSIALTSAVFVAHSRGMVRGRRFDICAAVVIIFTCIGVFAVRWQDSLPGDVIFSARNTILNVVPREEFLVYRLAQFDAGRSFVTRNTNLIWNTEDTNVAVELAHALAVPNVNQFVGIPLIDGYEPFITRDLLAVTALHFASTYTSQDELKDVTFEQRKKLFESNMDIIGMMGGKYVMSGELLESPYLIEPRTIRSTEYDTPAYLYVNTLARPRIYFASHIIARPHTSLIELIDAGADFSTATYIDCGICEGGAGVDSGILILNDSGNGYHAITATVVDPTWLIISESYLPGWHATLDGKPAEIIRANGMYMAIRIPEGEHEVILQYEGIRGEARWLYKLGLFPRPPLPQ